MEPLLLQRAIYYARRGERLRAYQLLQAILCESPDCIPAWLWMSGVIQDKRRQRECLERVLSLDPTCAVAQRGLQLLSQATPVPSIPPRPAAKRIGDYLTRYNFISPTQCSEAVTEQQRLAIAHRRWIPLGGLLLEQYGLDRHLLVTGLMLQLQNQLADGMPQQRLGALLVQRGLLSVEQLGVALTQQLRLAQQGRLTQLGSVLVRERTITQHQLDQILNEQRGYLTSVRTAQEKLHSPLLSNLPVDRSGYVNLIPLSQGVHGMLPA